MASEIIRHETGSNVVMNCAVTSDGCRSYLVAGQESHCQLYHVNTKIVDESEADASADASSRKDDPPTVRHRKGSVKPSGVESVRGKDTTDSNANSKQIRFEIKSSDSIQTDFTAVDPLQRVVRISPNGKMMATGGTDGHIRVWTFPRMTPLHDMSLHTKEADDLDFSPDNRQLVSIAKDGQAIVTSMETGKELVKLKWSPPEGSKYLFKRCRFGVFEGKLTKSRLFTIANPFGKVGKQKGFLQQWDPETGGLTNILGIDESLASLAVRDDGRFVAVGTMFTGSVSIHVAYSLQVCFDLIFY